MKNAELLNNTLNHSEIHSHAKALLFEMMNQVSLEVDLANMNIDGHTVAYLTGTHQTVLIKMSIFSLPREVHPLPDTKG